MNPVVLSELEGRVLGSLIEKDITTPDYYPLSLNALVNACNQKNNRDPVMHLDEPAVQQALASLQQNRLAGPARGADSRVTKYEHHLQEVFNFTRGEIAVFCVLLLRGPQTAGELRGRSERMHRFEELGDVQSTLQRLIERDPPLVKELSRQPGTKESRYVQLLSAISAAPEVQFSNDAAAARPSSSLPSDRVERLESELAELRRGLDELNRQFANFRKQFE